MLLLLINVLLLAAGTFMDMTPAVLIFTPIFWPVVQELGMTRRPFRYHDDCQPVYRALHAAGGHVSFRGMRRGQDAHVASDSRSHSLFPGSLGCLDAGHFPYLSDQWLPAQRLGYGNRLYL